MKLRYSGIVIVLYKDIHSYVNNFINIIVLNKPQGMYYKLEPLNPVSYSLKYWEFMVMLLTKMVSLQ